MIRPVLTEIALFLAPFAAYLIFLWAMRTRVLDPANWSLSRVSWLTIAAFVLMIGSFLVPVAFRRRPARIDLRAGPHRRTACSCRGTPSDGRYLSSRRRVAARPAARATARGARPRRRGGAGRRRRSAQHAARRAARRHRHRHHGAARRGDPPGRAGRLQGGADRHRARHHHGDRERQAVRGHDAARGCRDLRAPRQSGVRPRLAARRRAPRLHHEWAVGHGRRHGPRLCRRARRPQGAARAFHRRGRDPHRRGLSAHPAVLPLPRGVRPRPPRPRRPTCLHRWPRRPRSTVARAHPHRDCSSCCWPSTRCRRSR